MVYIHRESLIYTVSYDESDPESAKLRSWNEPFMQPE